MKTRVVTQAWVTARQMRLEGGFQGRTNKLVDGCYSFWQGGTVALLPRSGSATESYHPEHVLMDTRRLQRYILRCCQRVDGGLRDKPSKCVWSCVLGVRVGRSDDAGACSPDTVTTTTPATACLGCPVLNTHTVVPQMTCWGMRTTYWYVGSTSNRPLLL